MPDLKDVSAVGFGAGKQHLFVRCPITHQDTVTGRRTSSHAAAVPTKTLSSIEELQEEARNLAKRSLSRRPREVVDEVGFWLSEMSAPESASLSEKMCESDEGLVNDLYLVFTLGRL